MDDDQYKLEQQVSQQQGLVHQINRIEHTVNMLSEKMDIVIEVSEGHEENLVDLKSEIRHYGVLMNTITASLKADSRRANILFTAIGCALVMFLVWVLSRT
jgi:hypothetical protein